MTQCLTHRAAGGPCGDGPGMLSVWPVEELTGPAFTPYLRVAFSGSADNQVRKWSVRALVE